MSLQRLEMCANLININHSGYTVLDAGCRTMDLKKLLKGCNEYYGSDLIPSDGVLQCDLENRLPFNDNSFDIVVALDVLEHLDNPHQAFHELLRVSKGTVIVSFPNMYYAEFRLRFLLGNGLSGKYNFPTSPIIDRHRWVLSYTESVKFIDYNVKGGYVQHSLILPKRGRTRFLLSPIERLLANKWPDLFAYGSLSYIRIPK